MSEAVLDEAGALPIEESAPDQFALEAAIDADVDQFRAFLAELDPADFIDTTATDAAATDPDDDTPPRLRDTSGDRLIRI